MACSKSPLAFTGFHGARTITGAGAATHMLGRFRTSLFRIEFQGHENVSAKCLETSPRNVSRKHLRKKRFSDEQGRIRHTGVSSSFREVETITKLSFHRTLRPHEMQVLRFHSNSTQGRSVELALAIAFSATATEHGCSLIPTVIRQS